MENSRAGNARSLRELASLATPMSLRVAATLRLADRITDTGTTADDLAATTDTEPRALTRVLDHLVAVGVLCRTDNRYQVTELGSQLRDDNILDELDVTSAIGHAQLAFVELPHAVATGSAAYPRRYGRDFWADLAATPELGQSFDTKMARRFRDHAPRIARDFDWHRFQTVADIGGGQGTVLSAILTTHPDLQGHLVDLAPTAARAATQFATAGLADRVRITTGSFFDPLPTGADAYILSDILHDWDDEHAHQILARCADAAGPDGTVVLIEPVRGQGAGTELDLSMLIFFGSYERTIDELTELAAAHHLRLATTTPIAPDRTLLEFRR